MHTKESLIQDLSSIGIKPTDISCVGILPNLFLARRGDVQSTLCDAAQMADLTSSFLEMNPDLFTDAVPVPAKWYTA